MTIPGRNGVALACDDVGPKEAQTTIVLLHGFSSNRAENWRRMGWLGAFERRRMRAVAFDLRGHGESGKPHDASDYARDVLVDDVFAVMDAHNLRSAVLMGYSLGARLALAAALSAPERVERLILGGVGARLLEPSPPGNPMAEAMEAADADQISNPLMKSFRHFADEQGEDRKALAALARARTEMFSSDAFGTLKMPTLVVAGARDELAGNPEELAQRFPNARGAMLPGCDHFSAIAHVLFKAAVFDFLEETA